MAAEAGNAMAGSCKGHMPPGAMAERAASGRCSRRICRLNGRCAAGITLVRCSGSKRARMPGQGGALPESADELRHTGLAVIWTSRMLAATHSRRALGACGRRVMAGISMGQGRQRRPQWQGNQSQCHAEGAPHAGMIRALLLHPPQPPAQPYLEQPHTNPAPQPPARPQPPHAQGPRCPLAAPRQPRAPPAPPHP